MKVTNEQIEILSRFLLTTATLPPGDDDGDGGHAGPRAVPVRHRAGLGSATAFGHRGDWGLITSTLLTLVVLPSLYRWFEGKEAME
jgi:hypothetical protein